MNQVYMIDQPTQQITNNALCPNSKSFYKQNLNSNFEERQDHCYKNNQNLNPIQEKLLPQIRSQQIIYQNQISLTMMNQMENQSSCSQGDSDNNNPQNLQNKKYFNRSSNNSHKKYNSAAKKNLFKLISSERKKQFIQQFKTYKSSRVYLFCLLTYAFINLTMRQIKKFIKGFVRDVKKKILQYEEEAKNTENKALGKFRLQEIQDLKLSLVSLKLFATRSIEQGIQVVYKKNRGQILKLAEYKKSVITINQIQKKANFEIKALNLGQVIDAEINRKIKSNQFVLCEIPAFIKIDFTPQKQPQIQAEFGINCKTEEKSPISPIQQSNIEKLKQIENKKTKQQDSDEEQQNVVKKSFTVVPQHQMQSFPFMPGSSFMNFPFEMNQISQIGFNMFPNPTFKYGDFKQKDANQKQMSEQKDA